MRLNKYFLVHLLLLGVLFAFPHCKVASSKSNAESIEKVVTLNQNEATLEVGESVTLKPGFGSITTPQKVYYWQSDNPDIINIDQNKDFSAVVRGEVAGRATVILKSEDGEQNVACNITVIDSSISESHDSDYEPQGDYDKVNVEVVTDNKDAVYSLEEPIYFNILVESDGAPVAGSVEYLISNDGETAFRKDIVELENGVAKIEWVQKTPAIVRCNVTYMTKERKVFSDMVAAAVDPYSIKTTAALPIDFLDYWNGQKEKLAKIPMNPQLAAVENAKSGTNVYDIKLDNVKESNVRGYFGEPSEEGTYPALLYIPGAGVGSASQLMAQQYASKGFLVMAISVHDLPNGESKEFYKDLFAGPLKGYYFQGREDRDTYYYNRVLMGCIRAIDYLTSHPQWDKKHMVVFGSSQGGGMTLMTAGLDKRVTAAAANVPALCEHNGRNFGRPSGWPQLVTADSEGKLDPTTLKVSGYYDAVNFARFINIPMVLGVGLVDNTCCPTTVFSAYNQLKGNKELDIAPLMGHSHAEGYKKMRDDFILKQAGK